MIACCHTQIFVGVVTFIGPYHLLSTYTVISACAYHPDSMVWEHPGSLLTRIVCMIKHTLVDEYYWVSAYRYLNINCLHGRLLGILICMYSYGY